RAFSDGLVLVYARARGGWHQQS
ncbi:uncharacterized protein METZ01_LOCUS422300, partial [marine metagenome]